MMVSLMRTLKRSITCTITCNLLMVSLTGYLNTLEHGNSVPMPKRFCEANTVKSVAVLLQNLYC